jgi:hypothetical protein
MGLKASATCELTFGQHGVPAAGWLVDDRHDGIAQMFKAIEYARIMVGAKAIATRSTGYLNALDYANTRVQGADMTQMTDKNAPRVTIVHHPGVAHPEGHVEGHPTHPTGKREPVSVRTRPGRKDQHEIAHQELAEHRNGRRPPCPSWVVARKCGDQRAGAGGPPQTVGRRHGEQ